MDVIRELVAERMQQEIPPVVERDPIMEEPPSPQRFNRVQIITGMRRCGKTFYLFQVMAGLLRSGVPRDRMLYFDFSDDRLPQERDGFRAIDAVLDEYWRQVPQARTEGAYLFLDEVQDCPSWQSSCRRVAENERVTLCVTGSSSKVSSEEIATNFRGRSHTHEMLPLSFAEYLRFHQDALPDAADACVGHVQADAASPRERTALEGLFDRYLVTGGFPGIQGDSAPTRIEVLQGYVRDVVARDVADRLSRPSIPLANQMALLILRNTSCEMSVNGIMQTLKDAGNTIGWERTSQMAQLFRQAYLYFEVFEYSRELLPGTGNPPKLYAIDPGLALAVSRASQEDVGKRLETAVYLELRRRLAGTRTDSITSYTEPGTRGRKVDFLVGEAYAGEGQPSQPYELLQVSVSIESQRTRRREVESLDAAMQRTRLPHGSIVTLREEQDIDTENGTVSVVPAWKWFLKRP